MIGKDEILSVASETGLTPNVVEKDYVLGWLLAAINTNDALSQSWIFKGGTCLKKCYFETYRFSEDLDYTLQDESHLDQDFLIEQFQQIAAWVYEAIGLTIPADRLAFDIYQNPRGSLSCEGKVYYESYFASGKRALPKIKLDLTAAEILVMPPSRQRVFHTYSDEPTEGIYSTCYAFPEVFGEKVRALGERGRPRDLYDVINLFRNDQQPGAAVVRDVLAQKCQYKGINIPRLQDMDAYRADMERNWEPMLGHQLPFLPSLDSYWGALEEFFNWLEGAETPAKPVLGAVSREGTVYRPSYGHLGLRMSGGGSMEIIRFAAGNRLCVNLDYTDKEGNRSTRVIEPYSLRRAQNGNILLFAVRVDDGEIRAYKIDQINGASITNRVFAPRFQVELNPSGAMPANSRLGTVGLDSLHIPQRTRTTTLTKTPSFTRGRTTSRNSFGPTYVYRCPACNKKFRRKTQDSHLNPHKTKDGWPCSGRTGYYEGTEY